MRQASFALYVRVTCVIVRERLRLGVNTLGAEVAFKLRSAVSYVVVSLHVSQIPVDESRVACWQKYGWVCCNGGIVGEKCSLFVAKQRWFVTLRYVRFNQTLGVMSERLVLLHHTQTIKVDLQFIGVLFLFFSEQ